MKKIAYVITQSEMGGAQKHILLLCEGLKNLYDITVYSAEGGAMIKELENMNIKHVVIPNMVREISPLNDFKAYKFLSKEFKHNAYDVVHCHSSKAGIIGREAAKRAKIKNIIYTAHGFVFNEPMGNMKKNIYKFAEKYEAKNSHNLICVDSNDVNIAESYGIIPKKSLVYIPNGIDFKEESYKDRAENDIFTFGLVANFYETKGHRYLIEAFNQLSNEGYKAKLQLIGEGILKNEMEILAKGNVNIEFLGYKKDAMNLMKNFDCFVLSSVKEGFPFVILEALKNKIPIIATKVGSVPQMLNQGDLGELVHKENVEELKCAMIKVMNDIETARAKAEKAYDICKNKYSIEKMIESTINIYEGN